MSIKDATKEIEALRATNAIQQRIDQLSREKAAFALKALMIAGHVSEFTMGMALGLAETLPND